MLPPHRRSFAVTRPCAQRVGVRRVHAVVLLLALATLGACTGEIYGGSDAPQAIQGAGADMEPWERDMLAVVEQEYSDLSTYASNAGGWGGCVQAFRLGGAIAGELASRGCVGIGVAAVETGAGGVVAAVCFGADYLQIDRAIGGILGRLVGYPVCGATAVFSGRTENFRVIDAEEARTEIEEQSCEGDEVASWNTADCRDLYCSYKEADKDVRSCDDPQLSCQELLDRVTNAENVAEMRREHLQECPHPIGFNVDGHLQAIAQLYQLSDNCFPSLCTLECDAELFLDEGFRFYCSNIPTP